MNRKIIISFLVGFLIFVGLVGYNYFVAQKNIRDTKPSLLEISLMSYPDTLRVGQTGTFIWHIDASSDLSTTQTAILWGPTASPSALTMADSPEAVNYPFHQDDYWHGIFKLPETFDVNVKFEKTGVFFFRAYAKVGNNYLWTDEKSIEILPNK
jgi:hypothetical protein